MTNVTEELKHLKDNLADYAVDKKNEFIQKTTTIYNAMQQKFDKMETAAKEKIKNSYEEAKQAMEKLKNAPAEKRSKMHKAVIEKLHNINTKLEEENQEENKNNNN